MKPEILVNFYRSIIESILTGSIMVWFGNMTEYDRNALSRVIRTARRLTGVDLPALMDTIPKPGLQQNELDPATACTQLQCVF